MKWLAAGVVGGVVALVALAYFIGAGAPPEATGECNVSGDGVRVNVANLPKSVGPYSGEQLENAALIINAGKDLGLSKRGQAIGVMTAIGESTLTNIDRGDAAGPDSRGLFQQRDNGAWGSLKDRMDPTTAATNFFKALAKVEGWESLPPTLAASRVQANADPFHYEKHWSAAVEIVDQLADAKVVQASDGETQADPKKTIAKYNLGPVREVTARAVGVLAPQFKIKTVGGHRESDPFPDHPSGLAADFMVAVDESGRAKGDRLASYLTEHADAFGVEYILWQQRSWYPDRGWKPMADRGSPTANHADHVHVTFKGTKGAGALPAASACAADEASLDAGGGSRVVPAKGPITSGFGPRNAGVAGSSRNHKGTDFGAPCGASIVSTSSGRVVFAGPMGGYGHMIEVDHGNGTRTRYAHMFNDGVLTRVGEKVKGGQEIAKVGNDGVSGGCHLHFEVLVKDAHVDPQTWLAQGKKS